VQKGVLQEGGFAGKGIPCCRIEVGHA
jgi:hypothetical protein